MNILLVDDQVNMRRSTAYVLEQDGHVIFEAASGAAAMDIVASNDIDVVVTDVRMDGDSDGAALLKAVKTRYRIACLTNNMPHGHGPSMTGSPERARQVAEVIGHGFIVAGNVFAAVGMGVYLRDWQRHPEDLAAATPR